jgi:recombinational DNA repair protein (RecF pathway)
MFQLPRTRITRPYCTSVALEEERVWVGFYRRVGNPAIAAEVIQHLDADADQKRTHPALYLRCKESLRRKKARQARTKRIRRFMRRILGGLLRHSESNLRP